jgi:N-methylhydantoinase A
LGGRLGVSAIDAARGVVRIANANMTNALRLVSTNKGYDPREFALMAFGGGGPMHAVALARELKVPRVIVPVNSAVFSAWGMLLTDLRRDYIHTFLTSLDTAKTVTIVNQFRAMEAEAATDMEREGFKVDATPLRFEHLLDLRYQGQEHTVKIAAPVSAGGIDADAVASAFHAAYEKLYTYRLPNPIQVVNFHLVARAMVPKPSLPTAAVTGRRLRDTVIGTRRVDFDVAGNLDAVIYNGALMEPGMQLEGPAVIQEPAVTLVVPPGERVTIDRYGNYHVHLQP